MYRYKYLLDLVNELRDADHEGLEVVLQGPGPDLDVARIPAELRHPNYSIHLSAVFRCEALLLVDSDADSSGAARCSRALIRNLS